MPESRIQLHMNMQDVLWEMSEGNPGAITVMMRLLQDVPLIDPDDVFAGLGVLMSLDTNRIYGPRIWMLYKDVCGEDLVKMVASLRAVQLGFIPFETLNHAIDHYGDGVDPDALYAQVKERLPFFDSLSA